MTFFKMKFFGSVAAVAGFVSASMYMTAAEGSGSSERIARFHKAQPADPSKVVSVDACVKCHAAEIGVWKKTPHSLAFEELHRLPEAKQIAEKMGIQSIKYDNRCVACHYTQKMDQGQPLAISGVSCESCHGAAKDWVDTHHQYGDGATRLTESEAHREQRVSTAIAAGMRNPENVYLIAQSCYRCHTVQDEALVNVGGHNAGSMDFEFVSWSQGTLRHNFVRSDGKLNEPSTKDRLRIMFVSGMMAELEACLRATAAATEATNYGINAAKRTARAAARLQSVAAKVDNLQIKQAVEVYSKVKLRLGNGAQLTAAADIIARLGVEFAANSDGGSLQVLDPFVPKNDRWK